MALFIVFISLTITLVNSARDNIVPDTNIQGAYTNVVNHVKALNINDEKMDIRKEMEYISSNSIKITREIFKEYFNNNPPSFTENPSPPTDKFYGRHQFPDTTDVYILGAGSFAAYEATGTSDLDILIIAIDNDNYDEAVSAVKGLREAVKSYGDKLVAAAKVKADGSTKEAGLFIDLPDTWAKAYKSLEEFQAMVKGLHPMHQASEISTLVQSTPIWLRGKGADYHRLMRGVWEMINDEKRVAAFRAAHKAFYNQNMGRHKWKKTVDIDEKFDFKVKIIRPITLTTLYFYQLIFHEQHQYAVGTRHKSTLRRLYFLGEWGYMDIEAIQDIEDTFLWAHKQQLKANMIPNGATVDIRHNEKAIVHDGWRKREIEEHLEKVEKFMNYMLAQVANKYPGSE